MTKTSVPFIAALFLILGLAGPGCAMSDTSVRQNPGDDLKQDAKKGWFFYKGPVKPEEKTVSRTAKSKAEPKKDPCQDPTTWQPKCGFVDPGTDFDFQAKQRDALIQSMVMNPSDSKSVEAFQYYNKWAVERATAVANMWQYNTVQNPKLDPAVNAPISQFALQIASDVKNAESKDIFDYLSKNGMLLFFTRSDCVYCHSMSGIAKDLTEESGIPLWNVSLDDKCLSGFESKCVPAPASIPPAQALQIATVPTIFLYVKPNTWIRVATGVVATNTVKSRIVNFVTAYRAAVLKGVASGGDKPVVDFSVSNESIGGNAVGVPTGSGEIKMPTQADIETMLKAGR